MDECFAPLDAYAVRVQEIQSELREKLGSETLVEVVVSSDEQDPLWWEDVKSRGWLFVDHGQNGENTAVEHGAWWVIICSDISIYADRILVGMFLCWISSFTRLEVDSSGRINLPYHFFRGGA